MGHLIIILTCLSLMISVVEDFMCFSSIFVCEPGLQWPSHLSSPAFLSSFRIRLFGVGVGVCVHACA